jgi:uncharacterized protein
MILNVHVPVPVHVPVHDSVKSRACTCTGTGTGTWRARAAGVIAAWAFACWACGAPPAQTQLASSALAYDRSTGDGPPATPLAAPSDQCGAPDTAIAQIQGSGAQSPLSGQRVAVEAVVVGDFQDTDLNGLFLQQADARVDADPNTSEGLFVYEGALGVTASTGDLVRVLGRVAEYGGLTELTDISALSVCPGGGGSSSSASATRLALPLPEPGALERLEGMLLHIEQTLTVTSNFELGRFGTLELASDGRLWQPTQVAQPGPAARAVQAANALRRIRVDDFVTRQNPTPIPYLDADHTRRTGDTLSALRGVVDERFGAHRIEPTEPLQFSRALARPSAPDVSGRLRVASFNVLNYFTTLDRAAARCGPGAKLECRGANTPLELERQRAKLVSALERLDADVIGLVEIENDAGAALADLVSALNAALGAARYAALATGAIGSDAIKVALIYRPATVEPFGAFALLDQRADPRFQDTKHRPVLAQTFKERKSGARFTVAVNHWKSKGSSCDDVGDPDLGDGQGNCNRTRLSAAHALVDWLRADPTRSGDPDHLILGDLNAYAREEPIAALIAGGYTSLVERLIGAEAYSYQFDGQFGYLDHALASASLLPQVKGLAEWHINADEPIALDYNLEARNDDRFDPKTPYRASDHDPVVVGLDLVR